MSPWFRFLLPFALAPVPVLLAYALLPEAVGKLWGLELTAIVAVDVAIVFVGLANNLEWWLVLGVIVWLEFLFAVWLVTNLALIRRWAPADRFFRRRESRAEKLYTRHAWLRRFHFFGVALFTFLPLNSGIILGTMMAKVTGLDDRRSLWAVFLGSATWATFLTAVFAASIDELKQWVEKLPGLHG